MKSMREWREGDQPSASQHNEVIHAARELQESVWGGGNPGAKLGGNFWGIITAAGPNGAGDYEDERYWVKRAHVGKVSSSSSAMSFPAMKLDGAAQKVMGQGSEWIVTAVNTAELTYDEEDKHQAEPGEIVRVHAVSVASTGGGAIVRYLFDRPTTAESECEPEGSATEIPFVADVSWDRAGNALLEKKMGTLSINSCGDISYTVGDWELMDTPGPC